MKTQISIAGFVFLISTLCACGGGNPATQAALAAIDAAQASSASGGQAGQHGKGKGAGSKGTHSDDTEKDDLIASIGDETCDAAKIADPTTVILCDVGTDGARQVCTDADTALIQYGLDPSKPNLTGRDGDHLGAC